MWYLKILSGEQSGTLFPLKLGTNVVGRASHCDVVLTGQGVSKEHLSIEVYNDKIIVKDLKSRNGTFLNGVQIKSEKIKAGDRLAMFDIFFEVTNKAAKKPGARRTMPQPTNSISGNLAHDQFHSHHEQPMGQNRPQTAHIQQTNFFAHLKQYFDDVVMPGIYKVTEWLEFRWVVGLFIGAFIVFVTTLSTIPLLRILKESIQQESSNRSLTIARGIARENRNQIAQGNTTAVSVSDAQNEPGVKNAYILSGVDGRVLAPSQFSGDILTSVPFVAKARTLEREAVEQIDDSTIVAVVPITVFNSTTGQQAVGAYSVIVYDMATLAVGGDRTLSLFVQVLFIAILVGGVLYFFLMKIIEQPLVELNTQLTDYLKNNSGQFQSRFQIPQLVQITTNLNSALSRASGGFASGQMGTVEVDRTFEVQNLVTLFGSPTIAVRVSDQTVMTVNEPFQNTIAQGTPWVALPISQILDLALKLNLQNLVEKVVQNPNEQATDHIDIQSHPYQLIATGVAGSKDLNYVIITFLMKGVV